MTDTTGNVQVSPKLSQLQMELMRLSEALSLAERDRQLLGYDLHDGVVQDLTAAALLLEGAGSQAQFVPLEAQESFSRGLRLLREAIAEARRLIHGLATIELDERGLPHALQRLVDKFRIDHGLPATFVSNVRDLKLPPSVQHLLLRIAQESLFNVWKHAQAKQVEALLTVSGPLIELTISDDGIGFDPAQVPPGHFGLEGIRARARVLGAALHLQSAAGKGTLLQLRLTLPDAT